MRRIAPFLGDYTLGCVFRGMEFVGRAGRD